MLLYTLGIHLYGFVVKTAALFNGKAKLFVNGRKNIFDNLKKNVNPNDYNIWLHASSLGEFEQGRPVIEKIRENHPDYKIIVTFFSPSGYEIRKNYKNADYICYMPLDTPKNAEKFLNAVNPKTVFFVKYDFWYNFLEKINQRQIPLYIFSTIFRENQIFFKWYGEKYRKVLTFFNRLFVQNQESVKLLKSIGITQTTVAGDTRFDRVCQITRNAGNIELIDRFSQGSTIIVAGSTWPPDENILIPAFEQLKANNPNLKLIVAPHEIHQSRIDMLVEKLKNTKFSKYSKSNIDTINKSDVLIIDNIGMLSKIYKYATLAYVGGGFGVGIHNILEAVSYSIPVIFGPNYKKFKEAVDLVEKGGAYSISTQTELNQQLYKLLSNNYLLETTGKTCLEYVNANLGATEKILKGSGF